MAGKKDRQRFLQVLRPVALPPILARGMEDSKHPKSDNAIYMLGVVLGIGAGILDVKAGDLLLTALFVLCSTMLLGALRPSKPWRWTLLVGVFVPIVQALAFLFLAVKPYPAQVWESFLGFLTGIAGAYGGSVGRRGLDEILRK
jgi:hypothetical protein